GGPDYNSAVLFHAGVPDLAGAEYLGLKLEETRETNGFLADKLRAIARQSARAVTDQRANDRHIAAVHRSGVDSPFCTWIYSYSSGHTGVAVELLEERHSNLPNEIRLGWTLLPHEQYLRDAVAEDPDLPLVLKKRGLLD